MEATKTEEYKKLEEYARAAMRDMIRYREALLDCEKLAEAWTQFPETRIRMIETTARYALRNYQRPKP